ncbi:MAG: hypothetical protein KZQ72_17380 [Candidatus Thiodiazotropha sp. (ex Cardiolucina cf. quadrata)]|nr:hypothetical protein [Candidatus Thiodiazotropha sp. (ex Cardiolucina cf. quadrata)]
MPAAFPSKINEQRSYEHRKWRINAYNQLFLLVILFSSTSVAETNKPEATCYLVADLAYSRIFLDKSYKEILPLGDEIDLEHITYRVEVNKNGSGFSITKQYSEYGYRGSDQNETDQYSDCNDYEGAIVCNKPLEKGGLKIDILIVQNEQKRIIHVTNIFPTKSSSLGFFISRHRGKILGICD